jgi:two-component system sensor histidine kinase UhpB
VLVEATGDAAVVEVRDDGMGFDTAAQTEGFGLVGIRERVFLVGGKLELESGGQGTLVRAELPIKRASLSATDQLAS